MWERSPYAFPNVSLSLHHRICISLVKQRMSSHLKLAIRYANFERFLMKLPKFVTWLALLAPSCLISFDLKIQAAAASSHGEHKRRFGYLYCIV